LGQRFRAVDLAVAGAHQIPKAKPDHDGPVARTAGAVPAAEAGTGNLSIAFYAMARLANDVRLAPGQSVTPDFAAHARGLLALLGQPHKIYDGKPRALSKEPAAKDGLRAHDRHLIAAFRSAPSHC
jgi:hypothetical protein